MLPSLANVPQEVLEHIAFFSATNDFLGPPRGILPLLVLNRTMYNALSVATNPHLYARIFTHKFDVSSAFRRMGKDALPATALAEELRKRSIALKRIRYRLDSKGAACQNTLTELLWTSYLMVLESDSKNERQLREYAQMNGWLKEYWFDPAGASGAVHTVKNIDRWPENTERICLALWLFWFLLKPRESSRDTLDQLTNLVSQRSIWKTTVCSETQLEF